MRNLRRFYEAVSSFDDLIEANPWHDSRDGKFGGDKGSWSFSCDPKSRSSKSPCAKKGNLKQDSIQKSSDKFAGAKKKGVGIACGSHARGMGKNIRCHDKQDMKLTKKARRKNPNAKPVIRGFMDKHG